MLPIEWYFILKDLIKEEEKRKLAAFISTQFTMAARWSQPVVCVEVWIFELWIFQKVKVVWWKGGFWNSLYKFREITVLKWF